MDSTKRIIFNTLVQYSRSVLNILLSLFSTRYIVEALGKSDYGLYVVIGGIVALLGFITNALVATTQRYVSFYFGKLDMKQVSKIFANSLIIHCFVSLVMIVGLLSLREAIISWLNIPLGREGVASDIYIITIFMLVVTIMIAPFKALFIARENIAYISFVEVCDGIIKLGVAFCVLYTSSDKLLLYAFLMLMIQIANLLALALYALRKFEECHILISVDEIDFSCMRQLSGFAGWSTYGMGAIVFRSQGIQLMLNRAYNTVMNAAYGIAMQVFGSVAFVASSVLNAMNPQIMKAEGEGNRARMLHLAELESKYSTILLMLIVVPLIFEMPAILSFWLKDAPEYSAMFCRFILCGFVIDQLTYGMNVANQAMGKIKIYTLLMYTPKILVLIPVFFLLSAGSTPFAVMCVYLASEALVSAARLPYIKYTCGMSIRHFMRTVIIPLLPLMIIQCIIGFSCTHYLQFEYRFILTIALSLICSGCVVWLFVLSEAERRYFKDLIRNRHFNYKRENNVMK